MGALYSKFFPPVKCITVAFDPFCSKNVILLITINWLPNLTVLIVVIPYLFNACVLIRKVTGIRFTNQQIRQIGTKGNRFEIGCLYLFKHYSNKTFLKISIFEIFRILENNRL